MKKKIKKKVFYEGNKNRFFMKKETKKKVFRKKD